MNNSQVRRRLFRKSSIETEEPIQTKYRKSSMSRQEIRHVQSRSRNRSQNRPQSQKHLQNVEEDVNLSDGDNSEWDDRVEMNSSSSRKASFSATKGQKGSTLRGGYSHSHCSCNCNSRVNELSNEVKLLLAQLEIMSNWVEAKFGTQLYERESLLTHYSQDFCEIQEIAELLTSTVSFANDDNHSNKYGNQIGPQNAKLNLRQTRSQSNRSKSTNNSNIENRKNCKIAQSIQDKKCKKGKQMTIKLENEDSDSDSDIELIQSELESDEHVPSPIPKTSSRKNARTRKEKEAKAALPSSAKNEVENTIIIKSEITSDGENTAAADDPTEVDLPEPEPSYYLYDPDGNSNEDEDGDDTPHIPDDGKDVVEVLNSDTDFECTTESDADDSDFKVRNRNRTRKKSIKAKSKPKSKSSKPVSNRGEARDRYRNRAREEYEKAGVEHLLDEIMSGKHQHRQQQQQQQKSSSKSPAAVKEPGQCDECGLVLANANTLKEHKKTHTNTRDFKCDLCDKAFFRSYNLREHYVTHLGPAGKSLKCQFCDKLFIHGRDLDIHERTHTGERPFMCHICPKTFNVKQHLTYHIRTHTGEKPCVCPDCHRGFSQPNCLRLHKKRCTGVPLTQRQKQRKTHRPLVNNLVSSLTARLAARSASEAAEATTTTSAKAGSTSTSTLVQQDGQGLPPLQNAPGVSDAPNPPPSSTSTWNPQHVPAPLFPIESVLTNLDTQ